LTFKSMDDDDIFLTGRINLLYLSIKFDNSLSLFPPHSEILMVYFFRCSLW